MDIGLLPVLATSVAPGTVLVVTVVALVRRPSVRTAVTASVLAAVTWVAWREYTSAWAAAFALADAGLPVPGDVDGTQLRWSWVVTGSLIAVAVHALAPVRGRRRPR